LPESFGRRSMLIAPGLLGGAAFLVGLSTRTQLGTAAGYIVGGLLWSVEFPVAIAMLARQEPRRLGRLLGTHSFAMGVLWFAMMYLTGRLGEMLPEEQFWKVLLIPALGFPMVGLCGGSWLFIQWRRGRKGQ